MAMTFLQSATSEQTFECARYYYFQNQDQILNLLKNMPVLAGGWEKEEKSSPPCSTFQVSNFLSSSSSVSLLCAASPQSQNVLPKRMASLRAASTGSSSCTLSACMSLLQPPSFSRARTWLWLPCYQHLPGYLPQSKCSRNSLNVLCSNDISVKVFSLTGCRLSGVMAHISLTACPLQAPPGAHTAGGHP